MDLATGRNERVLPEFLVRAYDVSPDGRFIVFDAFDATDRSRIWIAPIDRSQAPRRLTPEDVLEEQRPFFGKSGDIVFMQEPSPGLRFLYRMKPDGSSRQRVSESMTFLVNIAPDEKWAVVWDPLRTRLISLAGDASFDLCTCIAGAIFPDSPRVSWSRDQQTLFVNLGSAAGTVLLPWRGAETVPIGALPSPADLRRLPGARYVRESSVAPGRTIDTYAFTRQTEQSNFYRIPLP